MINMQKMKEKLGKQLISETSGSLSKWIEENSKLEEEIDEVTENQAVTNISNWTLAEFNDDSDEDDNEEAYRERLAKNSPLFFQKVNEIFNSGDNNLEDNNEFKYQQEYLNRALENGVTLNKRICEALDRGGESDETF